MLYRDLAILQELELRVELAAAMVHSVRKWPPTAASLQPGLSSAVGTRQSALSLPTFRHMA